LHCCCSVCSAPVRIVLGNSAKPDQAFTGLGDEMSPGSISQLTQSGEAALRVRFDGAAAAARRALLARAGAARLRRLHLAPPARGPGARAACCSFRARPTDYEITLEPNQHNILIALELPQGVPDTLPNTYPTFDYQLIAPAPTEPCHQLPAAVLSCSIALIEPLSPAARRLDLQLPPGRNPRSVELAQSLRAGAAATAPISTRCSIICARRLQLHARAAAAESEFSR
jgi:hypothetical protein